MMSAIKFLLGGRSPKFSKQDDPKFTHLFGIPQLFDHHSMILTTNPFIAIKVATSEGSVPKNQIMTFARQIGLVVLPNIQGAYFILTVSPKNEKVLKRQSRARLDTTKNVLM